MPSADEIADTFEGETFQNNTDADLRGDDLVKIKRVRHPHDHEGDALQFLVKSVDDGVLTETFSQFEVQERMQDGRWERVPPMEDN